MRRHRDTKVEEPGVIKVGPKSPTLNPAVEMAIYKRMEAALFGLTTVDARRLAYTPSPRNWGCGTHSRMRLKLCLHERLLAYLSPDTVTGDDGRHQNRCRGGCRLKWNMSQCLVRSDTVIYEAANQRPVDELLLTFSSLSHF